MNQCLISFRFNIILVLLLASGSLVAKDDPTIEQLLSDRELEVVKEVKEFRTRGTSNWKVLDQKNVLIKGVGKKNHYLIEFKNRCTKSKSSAFKYETHNGVLTHLDVVSIFEYPFGIRKVCMIEKIYALHKMQESKKS